MRYSGAIWLPAVLWLAAAPASGAPPCPAVDRSTDEVLRDPAIVLTWDSASRCGEAQDSGAYELIVTVTNDAGSGEPVTIRGVHVMRTPRPRGQVGGATLGEIAGLPTGAIAPGESASFTVRGDYRLLQTDEGRKANLHIRADGEGATSGRPFSIGINAHFAAPGATE